MIKDIPSHGKRVGIYIDTRRFQCRSCNKTFYEALALAGIALSVSSKGDSYDNALDETINGLCKAEVIHRRGPWKTRESVELATLEWVSWCNKQRLLEPIGDVTPAEYEAYYHQQQKQCQQQQSKMGQSIDLT